MHKKIYCPEFLTHTEFDWIRNVTPVDSVKKADIIVFSGGADINPALYNCAKHNSTWFNERRDALEVGCFNNLSKNQVVIGICRGAQLVTALNGGKLIQNVTGHTNGPHFITNNDLKFKIDGIEFNAEAYTRYGDYTDGENPYINISIYKGKAFTAYVTDEFNLCYNKEDINFTTAKIKSDNNIIATDIGQIDDVIGSRYGIPETLNINLTSLGRFLVNRVYQEINDIISKVEQA